jgi:hypothetical protein
MEHWKTGDSSGNGIENKIFSTSHQVLKTLQETLYDILHVPSLPNLSFLISNFLPLASFPLAISQQKFYPNQQLLLFDKLTIAEYLFRQNPKVG